MKRNSKERNFNDDEIITTGSNYSCKNFIIKRFSISAYYIVIYIKIYMDLSQRFMIKRNISCESIPRYSRCRVNKALYRLMYLLDIPL